MNWLSKISFVLGITSSLFLSSCLKPDEYPPEPILSDPIFINKGDSTANIIVSFTDGDGDIGLNSADTLEPYAPGTYYYYNFYLDYYEMMDGDWVRGTLDPSGNNFPTAEKVSYFFRLENITPEGKNKALKGQIDVTLEPIFFNPGSFHSDSIKYEITLIDRALNVSNVLETGLIVR